MILKLLKTQLKGRSRNMASRLCDPQASGNRIKIRLILGMHSAHGVEVFRTVQEKVEKEIYQVALSC